MSTCFEYPFHSLHICLMIFVIHKKQRIYQQIYCSWNSERNFPQQDACFSFAGWPSSSQRHACWQDQSEMHTTPGTGASSTVTLSLARRCARVSSLLVQPSPSSQPSWASSTTSATINLGMLLAVLPMAAPASAWALTIKELAGDFCCDSIRFRVDRVVRGGVQCSW